MAVFIYKAKKGPDETVDGRIEADSRVVALARLDALGLSPISLDMDGSLDHLGRVRRGRIPARDITVFTRQLAGLLRAGVPILRALTTIQQQSSNPAFKAVVDTIVSAIRDGSTLSETLGRSPHLFSELYVNMVRAGESASYNGLKLKPFGGLRHCSAMWFNSCKWSRPTFDNLGVAIIISRMNQCNQNNH